MDNEPELSAEIVDELKTLYGLVRSNIIKDKHLMPVAFISSPKGMVIMGMPWRNDADKIAMLDSLKSALLQLKADMVVVATEAWMVICPVDTEFVRAAEHPERKEVVIMLVQVKDVKGAWQIFAPISRDGDALSTPEKMPKPEFSNAIGNMIVW